MEKSFEGITVLISGGATGIGAEAARLFAAGGAEVAVNYPPTQRSREAVKLLIRDITESGGKARGYECDISDREGVFRMVEEIERQQGEVDALVCNAVVGVEKSAPELSAQDAERMLSINFLGALWCVQACLPAMLRKKSGSVLFMSSNAVANGGGGSVLYPAAKGALEGMMNGLLYEYASSGLRFNCIRPGATNTPLQAGRYSRQEWADYQKRMPTGRTGEPSEVAETIVFLSDSRRVGHINGAIVPVDGARTYHMTNRRK